MRHVGQHFIWFQYSGCGMLGSISFGSNSLDAACWAAFHLVPIVWTRHVGQHLIIDLQEISSQMSYESQGRVESRSAANDATWEKRERGSTWSGDGPGMVKIRDTAVTVELGVFMTVNSYSV
ncbi:hypothetical protein ElyMa_000702800 [Elysia marginata]|uniref:Uncharacterized protein n=1 Tax=Elysia marginata TaxID=1093978 RepID=A0AAV4GKW3_9GAST|nr:hypothetical protein ElyMa_000702800 [Elysia marginata]